MTWTDVLMGIAFLLAAAVSMKLMLESLPKIPKNPSWRAVVALCALLLAHVESVSKGVDLLGRALGSAANVAPTASTLPTAVRWVLFKPGHDLKACELLRRNGGGWLMVLKQGELATVTEYEASAAAFHAAEELRLALQADGWVAVGGVETVSF